MFLLYHFDNIAVTGQCNSYIINVYSKFLAWELLACINSVTVVVKSISKKNKNKLVKRTTSDQWEPHKRFELLGLSQFLFYSLNGPSCKKVLRTVKKEQKWKNNHPSRKISILKSQASELQSNDLLKEIVPLLVSVLTREKNQSCPEQSISQCVWIIYQS